MNNARVLNSLTWTLLAVALAWSLHTSCQAARRLEGIQRKQHDLARLQKLEQNWARRDAARLFLETQAAFQPPELRALAAQQPEWQGVQIRLQNPVAGSSGWQLQPAELTAEGASFSSWAAFLQACVAAHPPWRLRECTMTASGQPGRGRVSAVLEGLVKHAPNE